MYMGIENEFTVAIRNPDNSAMRSAVFLNFEHVKKIPGSLTLFFPNEERYRVVFSTTTPGRLWLANGGCVYKDLKTLEYASPECRSLEDFVLAEKAGDQIVQKICEYLDVEQENLYVMKRTATDLMSRSHTWGSHENYAIPEALFGAIMDDSSPQYALFKLFLASRQIFTGCGQLGYLSDRKLRFWVSPRMQYINKNIENSTRQGIRPLINSRDDKIEFMREGMKRLHVIVGDMNRSDWSLFLRFGATAVFLSFLCLRSGEKLRSLLDGMSNMVGTLLLAARAASRLSDKYPPTEFLDMVDIQRRFLDAVREKAPSIRERVVELDQVVELWQGALDAVSDAGRHECAFSKRLDWLIKKSFIEHCTGRSIFDIGTLAGDDGIVKKLLSLDIAYSRVNHGDLYKFLVDKGWAEEKHRLDEASRYCFSPPPGKSQRRVELVRYAESLGLAKNMRDLRWNFVAFIRTTSLLEDRGTKTVFFDNVGLETLKSKVDFIHRWIKEV